MKSLAEKILAAQRLINTALRNHRAPIILSSFGKDSMVLLHLFQTLGLKFPVLFHREPFLPAKYRFANRVIEEMDLTVYDYRPLGVAMIKRGDEVEIMNEYQTGLVNGQPCINYVPTGIVPPVEGQPFLCAKEDLLCKPLGSFAFPWDLMFIGHKATDSDAINGSIPVQVDLVQNPGGADTCFPLRDFTDADIWSYHEIYKIPIHTSRYNANDNYKEWPDKTFNPDYFEACTKCLDRDQPGVVVCPKTNLKITNISARVRYMDPPKMDYFRPSTTDHQPST